MLESQFMVKFFSRMNLSSSVLAEPLNDRRSGLADSDFSFFTLGLAASLVLAGLIICYRHRRSDKDDNNAPHQ